MLVPDLKFEEIQCGFLLVSSRHRDRSAHCVEAGRTLHSDGFCCWEVALLFLEFRYCCPFPREGVLLSPLFLPRISLCFFWLDLKIEMQNVGFLVFGCQNPSTLNLVVTHEVQKDGVGAVKEAGNMPRTH